MTLEPQDRIKFQVENKGVSFSRLGGLSSRVKGCHISIGRPKLRTRGLMELIA